MDKVFKDALEREQKSKRVKKISNFRCFPEDLEIIKEGAKIAGVTFTMFVSELALAKAKELIKKEK